MQYTVTLESPAAQTVGVTLEIDQPDPDGQRLRLPAWIPGSYMIRDFARHILSIEAENGDAETVDVEKVDKDTWRCQPVSGVLRVHWRVHLADASVRAGKLDSTGGFFNGTSVFLQPLGLPDGPFAIALVAPDAPWNHWQLATAMTPVDADDIGFGHYHASSYEELVDHPVMFGDLRVIEFVVRNVPHRIVLSTPERLDESRFRDDLARICEQHASMFGELPISRYDFLIHVVAAGYGGLEHAESTLLEVTRDALPRPGDEADREAYRQLLGLCSHEYFHLWHVKRIRPAVFCPIDLSRETHTRLLWAFEGMTSYYDDRGLLAAGLLDARAWLGAIAGTITRVYRGQGRHLQCVAESSFDAWTRFYKADENAPNAIVSYYAKGALIAMALDLLIRAKTGNASSLDDVMRHLWRTFGHTATGIPEDGVEQVVEAVAGESMQAFFDRCVYGTDDPDLEALLKLFGVRLTWERSRVVPTWSPELGASLASDRGMPKLTQVLTDRAARRAGLRPGDRIVAVDGVHAEFEAFASLVARLPREETLDFHFLRNGRLHVHSVRLDQPPAEKAVLQYDPDAVAEARDLRAGWIGA